jgi:hypothetical protein
MIEVRARDERLLGWMETEFKFGIMASPHWNFVVELDAPNLFDPWTHDWMAEKAYQSIIMTTAEWQEGFLMIGGANPKRWPVLLVNDEDIPLLPRVRGFHAWVGCRPAPKESRHEAENVYNR